jgi:hypothetical protein
MYELRKCTMENDIVESYPMDSNHDYEFIGLYESIDGILESIDDFSKDILALLQPAVDNLNNGLTTLDAIRGCFSYYIF